MQHLIRFRHATVDALAILGFIFSASLTQAADPPYARLVRQDGALAYYRFQDTLARDNVNVNSGTLGAAGDATNTFQLHAVAGALVGDGDRAEFFDTGNTWAMIPYNSSFNPDNTKPFTIEAWYYPSSDQINVGQCTLNNRLAGSAPNRTGWVVFQRSPNDTYTGKSGDEGIGCNFRMYRGSGSSTGLDVVSGVPYEIGKWTHVVVVYDPVDPVTNASLTIYINGVAANTNVWTGGDSGTDPGYVANAGDSDVALSLGAYNNKSGAGGNPYFGAIDEFAVYSSKLTPEQILTHYQNATNANRGTTYAELVKTANPVVYLRLNELSTLTATSINSGDVHSAGRATHRPGVRVTSAGPVSGQSSDGAAVYQNRNGNTTTLIPFLPQNNSDSGVPFTFETWLKPKRDNAGGPCPVNNRWVGGTGRTGWVIFQRGANLSYNDPEGHGWCFRMYDGQTSTGQDVLTDTDFQVGQWGHLVVTWMPEQDNLDPGSNGNHQSQGVLTAFFNGFPVASNTAALYAANRAEPEDPTKAASDVAIGSYNTISGLGNNAFEGQVGGFAIYTNYVLTDEQVFAHYAAGTNAHYGTNYDTLVLNAANDASAQRLMPPTFLRFDEAPDFPVANSGQLGALAEASLVMAKNDTSGPSNSGLETTNSAVSLDGQKGWVSLNNPAGLNIAGQITLEAWVKPEATQAAVARIVSHGPPVLSAFLDPDGISTVDSNSAPTVASQVFLRIQDTGTNYAVGTYDGTNFHGATFAVPEGDLSGTKWVYLVGTYDGTKWNLYRNGDMVASAADSVGSIKIDSAGWGIGASGEGWVDNFTGAIDEVAIYGKALTASQIKTHYLGVSEGPRLEISKDAQGNATISWSTGTLQHSSNAAGPYDNVPGNPGSPYPVPLGLGQKFYRLSL